MSTDSTCPFVAVSPEGVAEPTEESDPLLYLKKLVNHTNINFENANSCIRFILYILLFYLISLCFAFYLITQQSRVIESPGFGYCTVNVSNTFQQHSEQLTSLSAKLKQFELDHIVSTNSVATSFSLYQENLQNLHDLIGDLESQIETIRKQVEGEDIENLEVLLSELDGNVNGPIVIRGDQKYQRRLQAIEEYYRKQNVDNAGIGVRMAQVSAQYRKGEGGCSDDGRECAIPESRYSLLIKHKEAIAKRLIDDIFASVISKSSPSYPEKHTLAPVDSVWPFQHESAPESESDAAHEYM